MSVSTIRAEIPLCFGTSGLVRTKTRRTSASWAPEVQTFWPLTTNWSPSSTALVARAARSLPASGSLIPRAAVFSARMMGTAQSLIWSSLPNDTMVALTMPRP